MIEIWLGVAVAISVAGAVEVYRTRHATDTPVRDWLLYPAVGLAAPAIAVGGLAGFATASLMLAAAKALRRH